MKVLRANNHLPGNDCGCSGLKCFDRLSPGQRQRILSEFNAMGNWNTQSQYLADLVTRTDVKRRRARVAGSPIVRNCSFKYKVPASPGGGHVEVEVCRKAFISVHGITARRLATVQKCLKSGEAPIDKRGRHYNRPNRIDFPTRRAVSDHLRATRQHSPTLTVRRMYNLFRHQFPTAKLSYEMYRSIFKFKATDAMQITTFPPILEQHTDSQQTDGNDAGTSGTKAQKAGTASVGKGKGKAAPSSTLTSSDVAPSLLEAPQAGCSRDDETQDIKFKHEEFIMEDYGDEDAMLENLNDRQGIFGNTRDVNAEGRTNEESSNEVVCTPEFIKEEPPEESPPEESPFETVFCVEPPQIKLEVEENVMEEVYPPASDWDDPLEEQCQAMPTSQPVAVPIQSLGSQKRGRQPTAHLCTCVKEIAKKPRLAPKTFSGDVSIGPQPPPGPFDSFDASLHNAVIGFFVSLKRIPVEKRDPTKQKILELIDAIADHDLNPDWIKIMVVKPSKAPVAKSKPKEPVKIAPALAKVNLPNIMLALPQTNVSPSLSTQAVPKAVPHLLPKPQTVSTEGLRPVMNSGSGLMTHPHTSMPIRLLAQPQTMDTPMGLVNQQPTQFPINLPHTSQSQQTSTSMGLYPQEIKSMAVNIPTHPQTNATMGLGSQQRTPLPINVPPQPQISPSKNLVTQPITLMPVNLPVQSQAVNIETRLPILMQTTAHGAVSETETTSTSNTEIGLPKQLHSVSQLQTTSAAIDLPTHPPQSSREMEMPHRLEDEGPS